MLIKFPFIEKNVWRIEAPKKQERAAVKLSIQWKWIVYRSSSIRMQWAVFTGLECIVYKLSGGRAQLKNRMHWVLHDDLKKTVAKMEKKDHITKIDKPTDWVSDAVQWK